MLTDPDQARRGECKGDYHQSSSYHHDLAFVVDTHAMTEIIDPNDVYHLVRTVLDASRRAAQPYPVAGDRHFARIQCCYISGFDRLPRIIRSNPC